MRVLVWSELYLPYIGGAEVFVAKMMQSLRARDCEFLVISSHHDRELPDVEVRDGITIHRLPFRAAIAKGDVKAFLPALKKTAAIKREFAPDLVHVNAVGPSVLFHLKTHSKTNDESPPMLLTMQQEVLASQWQDGTLLARTLDAADWVVGVSNAVLQQLRAVRPAIKKHSSYIYNGVDPPQLTPTPLPTVPHFLCLGRLVPAKGFDIALRAFASLAQAHSQVRFTVAGDGASGTELQALARDLGLAEGVRFCGWVDPERVPELLNTASVVVMPSRREGLPIVAVQAALMARPIVGSPVGGIPEVVIDGKTGMLVEPENPEALARALEQLLENADNTAAMGARARLHALSVLDWERTVAAYYSVYERLVERTHAHA